MEIRINNILDLQLANEDVVAFVDLFGALQESINSECKKVGFKKNGRLYVELKPESIEFIIKMCDAAGIVIDETEDQDNIVD